MGEKKKKKEVSRVWGPEHLSSALRSRCERIKYRRTKEPVIYPQIVETEVKAVSYPSFALTEVYTHNDQSKSERMEVQRRKLQEKEYFMALRRKNRIKKLTKIVPRKVMSHEQRRRMTMKQETAKINAAIKLNVLSYSNRQKSQRTDSKLLPRKLSKGTGQRVVSKFKSIYDRGDLPACIGHGAKRRLQWKCRLDELKLDYHIPLFFDGLTVYAEPYCFLAFRGVLDLLDYNKLAAFVSYSDYTGIIVRCLPQLIYPMKRALNTKRRVIISKVMIILQKLVQIHQQVGTAVVRYYKQLLPMLNMILVIHKRKHLGDEFDYQQLQAQQPMGGQHRRNSHQSKAAKNSSATTGSSAPVYKFSDNMVDLVHETLSILEITGGQHAYVHIKHMVPMYHSYQACHKLN